MQNNVALILMNKARAKVNIMSMDMQHGYTAYYLGLPAGATQSLAGNDQKSLDWMQIPRNTQGMLTMISSQ